MSRDPFATQDTLTDKLEQLEKKNARKRQRYSRIFAIIPLASTCGFMWGFRYGVDTLLIGGLIAAFGFYVFLKIERDYDEELAQLRRSEADLTPGETLERRGDRE